MESFIFGAKNKCQMTEAAEIGSLPDAEQGPYLVSFVQSKTLFYTLESRAFSFFFFASLFVLHVNDEQWLTGSSA